MSRPEWEVNADKRWRPAAMSVIQVDGRSVTGQGGGGKKRVQRDREASLTGEIWGQWEIGPGGGRNGMNDPENGRRNCGEEGLDKIVINKRNILRIERSLTEYLNPTTS